MKINSKKLFTYLCKYCAFLFFVHLFFCNILSAIELRIDLSTYDGSAASPWNVIPLANANSLNSNLIDYLTGNVTSVSLIGSGWNGGWYGSASPSWNATGASDRLYCSSGSASWTFSNLGTSNYSVEIASEGDGSYTYFTVNSLQASYSNLGNTVYPWYQNNPVNDWLIWSSVTPISGQITINCSLQSGSYLNMNMIRLVELPTPPTVTTQAVSNITTTTATGNGNITSLGTSNPTQHGHCWNTAPNPTIANSKTTLGAKSSTGTFTSSITGLTAGTLYYVRAYATNSVGTAYGAEVSFITVPNAPTANVATNINTSSITANWSASSGATGYYLDVSTASDFSSFVTGYNNLNVGNVTTYNITGLTPYTTYYYRVRAYNTSGTSSNSNTISDTSLYNGPIFYVNDLSLTNDIYTSKAGSNTINIGNQEYPFLTITHALSRAYSGCTIYVDAGTYTETVVITQNGISLIGADSSLTIIDPPGDTTITTLWGIYADTQTNLTIKNLRVTDAYYGIYMLNVDSSVFDNITVDYCGGGNSGSFYLLNSDSNIVRNCNLSSNWNRGLYLNYSHNNLVYNNLFAQSINNAGITFAYSNSNTLNNNYSLNNNGFGIYVTNCSGSIITNNIISENNSNGLYINYSSNDIITDNISSNNKMAGILIGYSNGCQVMRNVASNSSDTVNGIGIRILASSNLIFTQNTVDSNASYGFYIAGASSNCTFVMNNWISSPTNPDSAVYIAGDTVFNFTNNYWSTTDSNVISSKIIGNGVNYSSFRTTVIDTSLNADSIAPAAPSFISADTSFAKQIRLRWTKPALDENGGVLTGLNGYRLYRARSINVNATGDTYNWENFLIATITNPNDTEYIDMTYTATDTYYYRIVAFDSHLTGNVEFQNRSWYSPSLQVFARYNSSPETPLLLTPVNLPAPYTDFTNYGRTLNARPNLIWLSPTDADSNNLHFLIYCDSGQGTTLLANSATDTRGFYYYKNSSYETFTLEGVDSTVYANTIYYTPQIDFNDSIYIWSVQAYDSDLYSDSAELRRFKIGGRIWTDTPLIAGQTLIRKVHIDELREEINFARKFRGLSIFNWTDPVITANQTIIRKIHIDELRNALTEAKTAGLNISPVWTQTNIIAGETLIKKIDFEELREKLKQ